MEEEQIFNHLDDLNKKHQYITSMQKQEDKEIEEMNKIQEAKEEELVNINGLVDYLDTRI